IHFSEQAIIFHRHRNTNEALWKQARWHGVGHALVHQRHSDFLPWPGWQVLAAYISIIAILAAIPILELARLISLCSGRRSNFARYHCGWLWHFWSGFLSQWRGCSPFHR